MLEHEHALVSAIETGTERITLPRKMADFSDDYVAQLLAKDAKESSIKYSAVGLEAFLPSSKLVPRPFFMVPADSW